MKRIYLLTAAILLKSLLFAQEKEPQKEGEKFRPSHTLELAIGHTQTNQGIQANGKKKWLALPSWDLNYNYKFSPKWALGLHNEIIIEDFEVEEEGSSTKVLKRNHPFTSAVVASFKPGEHFSFLLGSGGEFSDTETLLVIRTGIEYGVEIKKDWEFNAAFVYDFKVNAYNTFSIGFGITKIF